MRWIRTLHLYSGLFMLPWVFLYGFTALLFNHSTWLSETSQEWVEVEEEVTSSFRSAESIADEVCSSLIQEGVQIELLERATASYVSPFIAANEDEHKSLYYVLDLEADRAYQWSSVKAPAEQVAPPKKPTAALFSSGVQVELKSEDELLGESFKEHLIAEGLQLSSLPKVEFEALLNGQEALIRFSPAPMPRTTSAASIDHSERPLRGTVTVVGAEGRDLSWRDYLLQLHEAHGYGIMRDARHFWAYSVDLMFLSMTFWGLSGVFMWWQLKRMRRAGTFILCLSTTIAALLAYGMHAQLVYG